MLKSFFLTVLLFVASTLLIAEATFSSPLPQGKLLIAQSSSSNPLPEQTQSQKAAKTESKAAANSKVNVPDCSVRSPDDSQCEKAPAISAPNSTADRSRSPYDMRAIERFNEELYGEGN